MKLANFFPYKMAILSRETSRSVSSVYKKLYGLNRQEWRILAALGEYSNMSAKEISEFSTLEKMQVTRATQKLLKDNLIKVTSSEKDKREKRVQLTQKGKNAYNKVVPLVKEKEKKLLSCLNSKEKKQLDEFIQRLHKQAKIIQEE